MKIRFLYMDYTAHSLQKQVRLPAAVCLSCEKIFVIMFLGLTLIPVLQPVRPLNREDT